MNREWLEGMMLLRCKLWLRLWGNKNNAGAGGNDGVRMLDSFLRNHPPTFKGRYDHD